MQVAKDTAVTLRYRISDPATGRLVEDAKEPIAYLHGGYGGTLEKVEAALEGKQAGDSVTLTLAPEDAFGVRDESLVRTIPKSEFPPGVKVGGQLEGAREDGTPQAYTVVKIKGPVVHLDGNHPWAGQTLRFAITVAGVRAATAEEIAHRHVHGEGGHHH